MDRSALVLTAELEATQDGHVLRGNGGDRVLESCEGVVVGEAKQLHTVPMSPPDPRLDHLSAEDVWFNALHGDLAETQRALSVAPAGSVDHRGVRQWTCLFAAATRGHEEVVRCATTTNESRLAGQGPPTASVNRFNRNGIPVLTSRRVRQTDRFAPGNSGQ